MTNTNEKTGIRYGVIAAQSLDPDLFDYITYGIGRDLTNLQALKDIKEEAEAGAERIEDEVRITLAERGDYTEREYEDAWDEEVEAAYGRLGFTDRESYVDDYIEQQLLDLQIEEPVFEFDYQGVRGQVTWLGGAQIVFIFESPFTGFFDLCSPCVPNATNLDNPNENGFEGYTVPGDWLRVE